MQFTIGAMPCNQLDIGLQIAIGLDFAGYRLAKDIERESPSLPPFVECGGQHLLGVGAGDEPPGVRHGVAPSGDGGGEPAQSRPRGHVEAQLRGRRQPRLDFVEIFLQGAARSLRWFAASAARR